MDNNKKNRVKINAFDVFLILLVLCLIGTLIFRIYNGISEDKNSYNNEYILTFSCDGEYDSILGYVKAGDAVYFESGELLGYIGFSENNKSQSPLETVILETVTEPVEEGDIQEAENESAYDLSFVGLTGVIELNGNAKKVEKGNYYAIGDENIIEGVELTVHTETVEITITVVSIQKTSNY